MKKMLFISNISNRITNFSVPSIFAAHQLGYEFHMAANYSGFGDDAAKYGVTIHHIDLVRNPLSLKNLKAYKQMLRLMKDEQFSAVHCNTPIGGILGRICGKRAKISKVIYTAHGFHFYKGASLINRTVFKWAEMWLAHYTDAIITINREDYQTAQKFKLRNGGKVYYVPGVGVDTKDYRLEGVDKQAIRYSLGLTDDDILLIAMGDLIHRKNYATSIKAIAKAANKKLHFLLCGKGTRLDELTVLAKRMNVESQIHFLGCRTDIKKLLQVADIFLFTTYQEGLPRSMMEAMAFGLPCVASKIRSNTDLIVDGKGGYLCEPEDIDGFAEAINKLAEDADLRKSMGLSNLKTIMQFDIENVKSDMKELYEKELQSLHGGGVNQYLPLCTLKRRELGIPVGAIVIVSVGELNKNKNHEVIIRAIAKLKDPNVFYIICGTGELIGYLKELTILLHVEEQVKILGFRRDIKEIYFSSNIFTLQSFREGLSRSLMEAMSAGLPCVVSKIRGNVDLIEDGKGGYLCEPDDVERFAGAIEKLIGDAELRSRMGHHNLDVIKQFDIENVKQGMHEIYKAITDDEGA